MWLIKSAAGKKSYNVGDVVKEKATDRSGIIMNHYMGRYVIEFETVADNPFKRETKSFTEEELSKNFSKGGPLSKKAAEDSTLDEAIVSVLINKFGASAQEEEQATEEKKEAAAAAFGEAADAVLKKATETFGEEFKNNMNMSVIEKHLTSQMTGEEKVQKIKELRKTAAKATEEVAEVLKAKFPTLAGHINSIIGIDIPSEDPKTMKPMIAHYATPNFGELYKFFLDAQLKAQEMPPAVLHEKLREYGGIVGPGRMRSQVTDVLEQEEEEILGQGYSERLPELMQELSTSMPAASPEPIKASKRNIYDIVVGDKVVDAAYGLGFVTSTASLDDGFVSVQFGDNVRIAAYAADKIATAHQVPTEEFQCPMDRSMLTVEACFGELPERACSFLKYIDDVPTCTYKLEMQAMDDKKDLERKKVYDKITEDKEKVKHAKKQLEEVLRISQFSDHDAFIPEINVPLLVTSFVKKRKANSYGRIVESALDDSVIVNWADGTRSVAWKVELEGITRKAFLEFVINKLMKDAREKVEDIARKKSDNTLSGDQFIAALDSLKNELNIKGIGEADFIEQYWEAVRRLGLPELAPEAPEVPVHELPDESLLENVQQEYGDTGMAPATASLKVEADEKLEQELTKEVTPQSHDVPYVATNNPKDPEASTMSIDVIIKDWSWVKEKDGQFVKLDKDNLIITKPDGTALTEAEWETFIVPNRKNISALLTPPPAENPEMPKREPMALAASKE